MRCGRGLAVSSALLFLSIAFAPYHSYDATLSAGSIGSYPAPGLLVSEFYACGLNGDEYIVLANTAPIGINLRNWSLSDGEGSWKFLKDVWIPSGGMISISCNSTSFISAFDRAPDLALDDVEASVSVSGTFRLADNGDSVSLISPTNETSDFVKYGDCSESSPGWSGPAISDVRSGEVVKRIRRGTTFQDSGSSQDWYPFREYKYGYTEFSPIEVRVPGGNVVAFTSPDCSLDVVLERIRSADYVIRLCGYELSSSAASEALFAAVNRGVDVRILVDGAPAGGMGEAQVACLSALSSAGADVRILNGNLSRKIVQHVGPLHSKYLVLDLQSVVVMSENFVESGISNDRVFANRGWGIAVSDAELAEWLAQVFDSDSRSSRPDVIGWRSDKRCNLSARIPPSPVANHSKGVLTTFTPSSECKVTFVPSPDASVLAPYLNTLIEESSSLMVEQFQADLYWRERWKSGLVINPFVSRLAACMREGGHVRMILDSTWFNLDRNQEVTEYLGSLASNETLEGEFKLMDPNSPITVVHNKGVVFDGLLSMISSNNWGSSSFASNRELAALVESQETAQYFGRSFELDWSPDDVPPEADAGMDMELQLGKSVVLNGSGSTDDRAIISWSWDTDGDGKTDHDGVSVELYPTVPGRYLVSLTVQDSWGNSDTDTVTIDVVTQELGSHDRAGTEIGQTLAYSLAGCAGVLLGVAIARRCRRPPRKINH
jgi:phosphatidylserine/phosphatidylglycerophosphate/cardiolipin synthase-like enzyme